MVDQTSNHNWDRPEVGGDKDRWGEYLNNTIDELDEEVVLKDTISNRPAAGTPGRWYLAIDEYIIYYDDGVTWDPVGLMVGVTNSGSAIDDAVGTLDFGADLGVTDNGDGSVTIEYTGQSSDTDTRTDLSDSSGTVVAETEDITFTSADAANVDVTDNGDGTGTVHVTATDTHNLISVLDNGSLVLDQPSAIDFEDNLTVTDNGDGTVAIDASGGSGTGGHTVSDDGTEVSSAPDTVDFGSGLIASGDGAGNVTVDAEADSATYGGVITDGANSDQAIQSGTWTEVRFDAAKFDSSSDDSNADPSTNSITIPEDGVYTVGHRLMWHNGISSGTKLSSILAVNGSHIKESTSMSTGTSGSHSVNHSAQIQLNAGDVITVEAWHGEGSNISLDASAECSLGFISAGGGGGGGGGGRPLYEAPNHNVPFSELEDSARIEQPIAVPDGRTLTVYAWGCTDTSGNTPSGLQVELLDPSGSIVTAANTAWTTDSTGIASYENTSGSTQAARLTIRNNTGSAYTDPDGVGAQFGYEVK